VNEFLTVTAQVVGIMAMGLNIFSFQSKRRNSILIVQLLGSVLWTTHFLLLASPTGAAMNIVAIIRNFLYSQKGKRKWASSPILPAIIIALFIACGLMTYQGFISILPIVGMTASSIALFITDERKIRFLSLLVSPPWLIYDAYSSSIGGVLSETFTIISILVAIYRFDLKKK